MQLLVSGDKYCGGGAFMKVYRGSLKDILVEVSRNHSYNSFSDEAIEENDTTLSALTAEMMITEISAMNGDGCDYITSAILLEDDVKIKTLDI